MFQKCARCALKREGGDSLCGDQTLMPFHTNITILAMPTTEVSVQPALETIDSLSDPMVTRGGLVGGWVLASTHLFVFLQPGGKIIHPLFPLKIH